MAHSIKTSDPKSTLLRLTDAAPAPPKNVRQHQRRQHDRCNEVPQREPVEVHHYRQKPNHEQCAEDYEIGGFHASEYQPQGAVTQVSEGYGKVTGG
jgi:hypothetical protein